jgi:ubiquinone biosynthesis monooxygenase Coq7
MQDSVPKFASGFVRRHGLFDALIAEADMALQVLSGAVGAKRPNPADVLAPDAQALDATQKMHAAGLMRVNHVGEICAQALYRGQSVVCKDPACTELLLDAAAEEVDHLAWCGQRLAELNARPSVLNPLWYAGSFVLGALAGRSGVAHNLGFVAETERQVEAHLDSHLERLPVHDERSRAIVRQMKEDEIKHRKTAEDHGASSLAAPVKAVMRTVSRVMTTTAYRI